MPFVVLRDAIYRHIYVDESQSQERRTGHRRLSPHGNRDLLRMGGVLMTEQTTNHLQ